MPTVLVIVAVVADLQGSAAAWHTFQLSDLLAATWLLVSLKTFPQWVLVVGRRTMGIYLLHAPVALVLARTLWIDKLALTGMTAYLLIVLTTLVLSLTATLIVERLGWAGFLFGDNVKADRNLKLTSRAE